jgi:multicomponent Na+:H+ antiporter subunit G
MNIVLQIIAIIAILIGTFFSFVGVLGYIRLPDVYSRMHATGKVGVFGVLFLLVAAIVALPGIWGRSLVLILLLMVTGPVTTHILSGVAMRLNLPFGEGRRNDMATAVTEERR